MMPVHFPFVRAARQQQGATLLVALVMLLVITLLALSSLRGVSLESRITGNLRLQKILTNAAEGGLRVGEQSISTSVAPDKITPCTSTACMPWSLLSSDLKATATIDTPIRFGAADANNVATLNTNYDAKVQWYVVELPLPRISQGNCALTGCGRRYYEVNACASTVLCTSDTTTARVILRSVIARSY
ncbi:MULTISPECIES: pilus assembly PilX family protein [unclassified Pseudomonas]|uniref:pilus assembly PilX family protein n=1 Tax=unclassified Pseudomonas TaxID=196821 RepID=UPI0025F54362|nr:MULTISPECIES: PilX N-terminal domain-containing pilus assembly protein [unclassified Pseudomonas]